MEPTGKLKSSQTGPATASPHVLRAALLVWVLWLGVDFFAHGGLFAPLYQQPSPFLLPLEQLFVRIPLGYAAFLIYAAMTVWLTRMLGLEAPSRGAVAGLLFGAGITVAGSLALLSIATIGLKLAAVWTVTQIVEFGLAGYVGVWAARKPSTRRAVGWIGGITLLLLAGGVVAQNVLLAGG